jgi:hypothetical protein
VIVFKNVDEQLTIAAGTHLDACAVRERDLDIVARHGVGASNM